MHPLLLCQNLQIKNGHRTLLDGVCLSVGAGESVALQGLNGSGKTSLLKACAGLLTPHAGLVNRVVPAFYMPHTPALFLDQCVLWNLEFYAQTFFVSFHATEVASALERVGLLGREKQVVRTLSAGQKRRLMLAALILLRPQLILADEPTSDLDTFGTELCLALFQELCFQQSALVVATHDVRVAQRCSTSVSLTTFAPASLSNLKPQLNLSFW